MIRIVSRNISYRVFAITRSVARIAGIGLLTLLVTACYLREEGQNHGLLIGSGAVNPNYLDDPRFAEILSQQFNSLSPENELKWSFVQPQQGVFNFTGLDRLVDFAQQHGMVVKGHGLISGCCNPSWVRQISDPDELRAAMAIHFNTIMDRYAGKMDRWDVVTEPLSIAGGTGLVPNFYYQVLGPDYIAEAFNIAHSADPDAKLFINESLVEIIPAKRQELYDLVADLVARGVPIHGVGLETHVLSMPEPGVITGIVNEYQALGLEVAITEMDVHVADRTQQANIYHGVLTEALQAGVRDISFWGFTDKYAFEFFPGSKPLLFDANYDGKPAFIATWFAFRQFAELNPVP